MVYVDGFNLYYGALRRTGEKWLDLDELCSRVLKRRVDQIRYFTAPVTDWPYKPSQPQRQQLYLRALKTLPNITLHHGQYMSRPKWRPLADSIDPDGKKKATYVRVQISEEKGSDVNLATHLIHDAHLGRFDEAAVITNDTDLVEPIRIVTKELSLPVGLLSPAILPGRYPHQDLREAASFTKKLRRRDLKRSQFPEVLKDEVGEFSKPPGW